MYFEFKINFYIKKIIVILKKVFVILSQVIFKFQEAIAFFINTDLKKKIKNKKSLFNVKILRP